MVLWHRVSILPFFLADNYASLIDLLVLNKNIKQVRLPLIYNFLKLGKSYLFQLKLDNNEFLISSCSFISELTLKIVFWEKSRKFMMDLKKRDEPKKSRFFFSLEIFIHRFSKQQKQYST